jgi:hypothetical protein
MRRKVGSGKVAANVARGTDGGEAQERLRRDPKEDGGGGTLGGRGM